MHCPLRKNGRLRFLQHLPRSRWLSFAGGASVAYVFLHVLPELSKGATHLEEAFRDTVSFLEHHTYLIALTGLVIFYGLERAAKTSRRADARGTTPAVFWLHIASFFVYNILIGYLLVHREEADLRGLLFYGLAMGLHLLVSDAALRAHHPHRYQRWGRWILAGALLAGLLLGFATQISRAGVAALFAFLAGGIVLNVLKEELPEERESRFSAFAGGALLYTLFLLAA